MNVRTWVLALGVAWCCLAASAPAVTIDDVVVVNAEGYVWVRHHDTLKDLPDEPLTSNHDFGPLRTVSAGPENNLVISGDLGVVWVRNAANLHADVVPSGGGFGPIVDSAYHSTGNIAVNSTDNLFLRDSSLGYLATATGFAFSIGHIAVQSNDDTVVLWNYAPIGGDIHIYRPNVGAGAWDNVTSRAGLGVSTAIAIQSNDNIVTGNADGQVKYYDSALGDLVQISGLGSIGALACLSDDTVIAGNTTGWLYALAADGSSIRGFDLGYGTVSAIAVQSDDDVIVANAEGVLRRVTIDFSGSSPAFNVTGYGDGFLTITDIAVLEEVPEPSTVALLAVGLIALGLSRWWNCRG
jgi:hypothetical protein